MTGVYQAGYRVSSDGSPLQTTIQTNRLVIGKAITVQSFNGPATVFISGSGMYRCVFFDQWRGIERVLTG